MPCLRHSSGALTPARASFNTAMIGSSLCRFRVMGLLLSAHHSTVELPSQWCSFRGEGHPNGSPVPVLPRFHHSLTKEWPDSPSLRASNEHSYIVRVLRA